MTVSGIEAEVEARLAAEAAFHDALLESEGRPADRFYAINARSWDYYCDLLVREVAARSAPSAPALVLEYGCGIGSFSSRLLAERGYPSVGIDISPASVAAAEEYADSVFPELGLQYRVMDAEHLAFPDDSFDVVCGNGILHHLDLDRAYGEIARVLASDGCAVFTEPLGHNPLINLYRRLTPEQRTSDEHPLRTRDIHAAGAHFGSVELFYFHLLSLLAIPLCGRRGFDSLLRGLERADDAVLRVPSPLRRYAWFSVMRLARPRPGVR